MLVYFLPLLGRRSKWSAIPVVSSLLLAALQIAFYKLSQVNIPQVFPADRPISSDDWDGYFHLNSDISALPIIFTTNWLTETEK